MPKEYSTCFRNIVLTDQLMGPETAKNVFPFLHHKLSLNFGYRGLWAEILITAILFTVSAFTPKTAAEKLEKTTVNYSGKIGAFEGLSDWRLHWLILALITLGIYLWLY